MEQHIKRGTIVTDKLTGEHYRVVRMREVEVGIKDHPKWPLRTERWVEVRVPRYGCTQHIAQTIICSTENLTF